MTEEDLARAKALPMCAACRKQSDGAVLVAVVDREVRSRRTGALAPPAEERIYLCGTDYDAWKRSPEHQRSEKLDRIDPEFNDFVARVQASTRNAVTR